MLCTKGGKLDIKNNDNKLPTQLATKLNRKRILNRLESSTSSVDSSLLFSDGMKKETISNQISEIEKWEEFKYDYSPQDLDMSDLNPLSEGESKDKTFTIYLPTNGDENIEESKETQEEKIQPDPRFFSEKTPNPFENSKL